MKQERPGGDPGNLPNEHGREVNHNCPASLPKLMAANLGWRHGGWAAPHGEIEKCPTCGTYWRVKITRRGVYTQRQWAPIHPWNLIYRFRANILNTTGQ